MSSEVSFLREVSHAIDLKAEMRSRTQILTAKLYKSPKPLKKSIPRIIDGDDEFKKNMMSRIMVAIASRLLIRL